jgi:hypothetical protein
VKNKVRNREHLWGEGGKSIEGETVKIAGQSYRINKAQQMAETRGTITKLNGVLKFNFQVLLISWISDLLPTVLVYSSPAVTTNTTQLSPTFLRFSELIEHNTQIDLDESSNAVFCYFFLAFHVHVLQIQKCYVRDAKIHNPSCPGD